MRNFVKKVSVLAVAIGFCLSASQSMAAPKFSNMEKWFENDLVKICEALQSNKKSRLRRAIKHARVDKREIVEKLVCNGMDPMTFALSHNSTKTAAYLAKINGDRFTQIAKK